MTSQMVLTIGRDALTLLLLISMPVLGVVMAVGLLVSIFQAVTQIHEATLAFVPKLIAAMVVFGIVEALTGVDMAKACLDAFLSTDFGGGRHLMRQLIQAHRNVVNRYQFGLDEIRLVCLVKCRDRLLVFVGIAAALAVLARDIVGVLIPAHTHHF